MYWNKKKGINNNQNRIIYKGYLETNTITSLLIA